MTMRYVSLHNHSTFSTGDGYELPAVHVGRAKELGMQALSMSEHGNVSSWVALEMACEKLGVEPIYAIEIYYGKPKVRAKTHMILIAMNDTGIRNINRIVTKSWQQFYYSPTVYWEDLVQWNEGIIALSGCADSALSCTLLGGKWFGEKTLEPKSGALQRAVRGVSKFQEVFGDRFYLEVQRFPGLPRTCVLNPLLAEISTRTGALLAATADVHYPYPEQNAMQRVLHASHRGKDAETADAEWEYDILLTYPQSDQEILKDLCNTGLSLDDANYAIDATTAIAQRCKGTRLPKAPLPRYRETFDLGELPKHVIEPESLLRDWITAGWTTRLSYNEHMQKNIPAYKKRMKHEYETICATEGFADYFLMVADIITWAKSKDIAVGPGRGSAAGSLVCYLLQITEIDSMQFPMLFERFLDPTRTDPPDIDIDFEDDRRDEVFGYAASKYGFEYVANIASFTRYLGRSSLDDVARVYHIPKWKIDAIKAKLIERAEGHPRFSKSLEDTFNSFPDIAEIVHETPEIAYATRLEGNIKSFGIHAAGMVVSSVPLTDICAVYEREINGRVGQAIPYDKRDAARIGLLKIDALSLTTMGEIADICREAGIKLQDLYRVPLDDNATLQAFRDGDIMGIFQFEGVATRRILKQVQPTKFMHLADVNALVRPGADDKGYISNKDSGKTPKFAHPIIAQHTTKWPDTYGVITYEEQILMVLRDLGGFEPRELNRMRKIIHDKLGSTVFNEYFKRFVKGAAAHGLSEDAAKSVWDGMVNASGYAFNIAHSVSYAHIGYWQNYLKIHYPAAFYKSKLAKCDKAERRGKFIQEAGRHGIEVLPPQLATSGSDWVLNGKQIVAGLMSVDGIGPATCQSIVEWRDAKIDQSDVTTHWELDELFDWDDLIEVKGIGTKTIEKIKEFVYNDDPFGVQKVERTLDRIRSQFKRGEFTGVPTPTHTSLDVQGEGIPLCYMGIARKKKYYDAVEQLLKRETEELSYEDGLARLKDNHLIKYVMIEVEDEFGEIIKVRVNRWKYPQYAKQIGSIKLNRDVIVTKGKSSEFGGTSIQTDQLVILNPEGE